MAPGTGGKSGMTDQLTTALLRMERQVDEHHELRSSAEQLVALAKPRFKDFRADFEKISNAASAAARESRHGLTPADALGMFTDKDWNLRIPLQRRYAAEGRLELVAHYHAKLFKLYLGRNEPWPDDPARETLELFAASGRADLGVQLVRTYVDMQHARLKKEYSSRNPRGSRKARSEGVEKCIAGMNKAIAAGIPDSKADLLKDIDSISSYVGTHGAEADLAWLENVRREIWMEKRA
jgi:hypothetical protein